MPDLTTEYAWACQTNREWSMEVPSSDGTKTYTVSWGMQGHSSVCDYDYSCTCPGFQHRGTCKHVQTLRDGDTRETNNSRCGWDGRWNAGDVHGSYMPSDELEADEPCCPNCRGPVYSYAYGA